jgi:hypothetical protein
MPKIILLAEVEKSCNMLADEIQKNADRLSQSSDLEDKTDAMKGYGSIGQLDKMDKLVKDTMENCIDLDVPLKVDKSFGKNLYETK